MSATRAQNEFGRLLNHVLGGKPVVITRHSRAVAVLLSADDYGAMKGLEAGGAAELDGDVAVRLRALAAQRGESLRTVLNDVLRRGLDTLRRPSSERPRYTIEPHHAGRCYLPDLDRTHDALVFGEGEAYR